MSEAHAFDGTLVTVPFTTGGLRETVAEEYRGLLDSHDPEEILVLTGTPTSMETFRDHLAESVPGAGVPRVSSLVVQASNAVQRTDDRATLSDDAQRELVARFVEDYDWETEYLRRASAHPSFVDDVAQVMEAATWQDASLGETPELRDIGDAVAAFHDWLADRGHLERGQLVATAAETLREESGVIDASAVLVVEFEEFLPVDRRFLSALADGRNLVCVAETDASVRRTWAESGPIANHVSFSERRVADERTPSSRPTATAAYLARGTVAEDPETGAVRVLSAETADEQLGAIADEIEALRAREDLNYDDFAVAVKSSGDAVTDAISELQRAGIPTESATVTGFGDDPAVRELLRVVRCLAERERDDSAGDDRSVAGTGDRAVSSDGRWVSPDGRSVSPDDLPGDEALLDALAEMDGLADPLRRWATESGLKARISASESPLDARTQFGNVKRAFRIAEFVEETDFIDETWREFAAALERAHEYAPRRNQTSSIDRDGGVSVDSVRSLKNGEFSVVFLLDAVDSAYPGDPSLTRLFPDERVARMADFPGVTDVDSGAVEATFATDSTASSQPFRRYHAEHARRRLAVGSATATDRVYFCLYEHEDTALDERVQPSRFLADAYRTLPWLTEKTGSGVHSERTAEEYLLSRADRALADVRRTHSRDVTVALESLEAEFAEIHRLLDDSGERGENLREALRARVDLADGRVRRDADGTVDGRARREADGGDSA